ncbi:MAG: glycosyltransferase [Eubacterium sp.]|nr:glycosyltransferase [Eubacterium sp.]
MKHEKRVLLLASVASMIDQFNMPNIRLLLGMGLEVHVACNFIEGNTCDKNRLEKLKERLTQMRVVWHQWDCPRNLSFCVRAYVQLVRWYRQYSYAWIHCQSPVGGALARLAARQCGIRVLYTAHGFHFYRGAPLKNWLLYYPAEKLLAYWTDVLITVNQEDYWFAKRNLKAKRIEYIPGVGVDIRKFEKCTERGTGNTVRNSCRKKYKIPRDALLLLSVGELSKRKNHQAVIRVLAKLSRKDVYYMICGQGALKAALSHQAKVLGVAKRVRFLGYQEQMAQFYEAADLFVFPSLQEGMPVALMEAMAAGLACVVSDIRGNRELIVANGGIRFSLKEQIQLLEALESMLEDERRRLSCGRWNQKKIQKFSQKMAKKKMKQIYYRIDHENSKARGE